VHSSHSGTCTVCGTGAGCSTSQSSTSNATSWPPSSAHRRADSSSSHHPCAGTATRRLPIRACSGCTAATTQSSKSRARLRVTRSAAQTSGGSRRRRARHRQKLTCKMLGTGLVSLNTNPGAILGLYPLHAVVCNGSRREYDFLTNGLPRGRRADTEQCTEEGRLISLGMEQMKPMQLAATKGLRYMFQVRATPRPARSRAHLSCSRQLPPCMLVQSPTPMVPHASTLPRRAFCRRMARSTSCRKRPLVSCGHGGPSLSTRSISSASTPPAVAGMT
jgi:hypothetical protein